MSKSQKRKKNNTTITIIAVIALLAIAYFVSNKPTPDPVVVDQDVEIMALEARVKGNPNAALKITEYSDFQCPACGQTYPVLKTLVDEFGDQFELEYKHFPLRQIHPNAQIAAQATEAAGIQGKFWEMHDLLFDMQSEWSTALKPKKIFEGYAADLGLSVAQFASDLDSDAVKEKVNQDAAEAASMRLPGTPSFVSGGEQISLQDFVEQLDTTVVQDHSPEAAMEEPIADDTGISES